MKEKYKKKAVPPHSMDELDYLLCLPLALYFERNGNDFQAVRGASIDQVITAMFVLSGKQEYLRLIVEYARSMDPDFDSGPDPEGEMRGYFERLTEICGHLRNPHGAETVGESLELLAKGKVDPRVVSGWIDDKLNPHSPYYEAIMEGYPQIRALHHPDAIPHP